MKHSLYAPQIDLRSNTRFKLRLSAMVRFDKHDVSAMTIDLSFGGVGIELPFTIKNYHNMTIHAVRLPTIGSFGCEKRWARGAIIGLMFTNKTLARQQIENHFAEHDPDTLEALRQNGKGPVRF